MKVDVMENADGTSRWARYSDVGSSEDTLTMRYSKDTIPAPEYIKIVIPSNTATWQKTSVDTTIDCLSGLCRAELRERDLVVFADPLAQKWDYQTFGIWERYDDRPGESFVSVISAGFQTPAGAIPTSGTATYSGTSGGVHLTAAGVEQGHISRMTAVVDFGPGRSLAFSTTQTEIITLLSERVSAPELDLSGKLLCHGNCGTFTGTVRNAAGTLEGGARALLYGPNGQELGGIYALSAKDLKSNERMIGGFGATKQTAP